MKNTIKRDKLGAVIAPTTKEENIFWANRKEIMAKSKAEGRDLHMDHLKLLENRNQGKGMDDWK